MTDEAVSARAPTPLSPLEVINSYPPHRGTLGSLIASRARMAPQREFLVFGDERTTYGEFLVRVDATAAVLDARGVRHGDRIAVVSHNHPSTAAVLFALARLGAIMVPVNPDFATEEARYVLQHAGVSGVVCSPDALALVRAACDEFISAPWLLLNEAGDAAVPVLQDETMAQRLAAQGIAEQGIAEHKGVALEDTGSPDDICLLIYTSGTTGFPKGVMHSQHNAVLAGEGFVARMHLQPRDRLLVVLPMFHLNAIFYSLAGAVAAGATLILTPRFSASGFWRTVMDTRATEVNTIAAITTILMKRPRSEFVPGHTLKKLYGAPLTKETIDLFRDEFGVPHLIEGYGMSEIPGALSNPWDGARKAGSMGVPSRHPDPAVKLAEMRVVDEAGIDTPAEAIGEMLCRSPMVMKGYYRDPAQTAEAFRDGWFLTGDLARRDAQGYHWFVARKKDIIRKRGENISGAELDRIIGEHPAVLEAAAIGVPAELGEEDILVALVKRPGLDVSAEDIAAWCQSRLAAIKSPRYVVFVESLPHTPTHRVAKFRMREDTSLLGMAVDLQQRG
ncbi:MAG: long-chain fatty acid--CoA ligase [Betaproteobacteria bacterium]|nr:long-chain fatty acid--CoA ligase [Betaproteobacteria bacterium]